MNVIGFSNTSPYGISGTSAADYLYSRSVGAPNIPGLPGLPAAATTGDALNTAEQINAYNLTAQQRANSSRIPGAAGLEAQSSKMIGQELAGEVPSDVLNQLGTRAAERGVSIGSPGSSNATAAYLRALGLTSIDQQQRGQQNLTGAYARNPAAPLFDVGSQLITPYQSQQIALQARGQELSRAQAQAQLEMEAAQMSARNRAQASALNGGGGGGYGGGSGGGGGGGPRSPIDQSNPFPTLTGSAPYSGPTAGDIFGDYGGYGGATPYYNTIASANQDSGQGYSYFGPDMGEDPYSLDDAYNNYDYSDYYTEDGYGAQDVEDAYDNYNVEDYYDDEGYWEE